MVKRKNKQKCVTFWIDEKIIQQYQKNYKNTLSAYLRYHIKQANKNSKCVTDALFNGQGE